MLGWKIPGFLWLGLTILPVLFFYFLRMRFRRHPVSSIYIWSRLHSVIQGGNKLRQRSLLLLFLQLLVVAAAVMAMAQPFWISKYRSQPSVLFLVDISASMSATDLADAKNPALSRLESAKEIIAEEIRKLAPRTTGMIIGCASGIKPLGNPTSNRRDLLARLQKLEPSYAGFMEAEVTEELQSWLTVHKGDWRVRFFTDGGLDLGGERLAVLLEGMMTTRIIGKNGDNLGVTALRVEVGERSGTARFLVHNGWPVEKAITVNLYGDTRKLVQSSFTVPPGTTSQILEYDGSRRPEVKVYKIEIDQKPDQLAGDDFFSLAVNPPRRVKVLIVGPDNNPNPFLKAALQPPQIELTQVTNFPPGFTGEGWDLVIADRVLVPKGRLLCNLLIFGIVPAGRTDIPVLSGAPLRGSFDQAVYNHPLLRYIDWRLVQISNGYVLGSHPKAQIPATFLATVNDQPILAAWEEMDGWRRVIFGTDLYHSTLGVSGAFPIFMANLLQWIVPQMNNPLAYTLNVGESVTLAEPKDWQVMKTRMIEVFGIEHSASPREQFKSGNPVGQGWKASKSTIELIRKGPLVTLTALSPGVFQWGRGRDRGIITANLAPGEMDTTPQSLRIKQSVLQTTQIDLIAETPLSRWLLVILLLALIGEWLLWRGLPSLK